MPEINIDVLDEQGLSDTLDTLHHLADYVQRKLWATQARTRGDIQEALHHEDICDALYNNLPAEMRW